MTGTRAVLTPLQHAADLAYSRPDGTSTIPFERRSPRRRAYWEGVALRAIEAALEQAAIAPLFAHVHRVRLLEDGWWTCGCGEQLTQDYRELPDEQGFHLEEVVRDALVNNGARWRVPAQSCPRCESTDIVLVHGGGDTDPWAPGSVTGIDCRACGGRRMIPREVQENARVVSELVYAIVDAGIDRTEADEPVLVRLADSPLDAAHVAQWIRSAHEAGREAGRQECEDEHTD